MLPFRGRPMALFLADEYAALGGVAFSVDRKGRFPVETYGEFPDQYPGQGPLNGIVSGFSASSEEVLFLTATDMPLGTAETAKLMIDRLGEHDACLFPGEPLFGAYRRSCFPVAEECLRAGERSMRAFLSRLDVLYLEPSDRRVLTNLNTPEEFRSAADIKPV